MIGAESDMPVKQKADAVPVHESVTRLFVCGFRKPCCPCAHIGEAGLIHQSIGDGPGMAQVPLLKTIVIKVAKAGNSRTGRLEFVVGLQLTDIVEIVINAETLVAGNLLIKAHGELISVIGTHWHGLVQTRSDVSRRNELLHQVDRNRILASYGNRRQSEKSRTSQRRLPAPCPPISRLRSDNSCPHSTAR